MKQYLFIGEERSQLAITKGWTWEQGRLAGKQLFDALDFCKINPKEQATFHNWFEWDIDRSIWQVNYYVRNDYVIVGMGQKVQKELLKHGIKHIPIVHPAARGKIRKKELYFNHVKEALA